MYSKLYQLSSLLECLIAKERGPDNFRGKYKLRFTIFFEFRAAGRASSSSSVDEFSTSSCSSSSEDSSTARRFGGCTKSQCPQMK